MSIIPVPATRVSNSYVTARLTQQVEDDQLALFKLQNELSTGSRLNEPSDDPSAAMLAVGLQSLLAQNTQYQSNLQVNSAYLSASDSALTQVNSLINTAQGLAVSATGNTATDSQRQAAATQLQDLISQMLSLANTQFSGRYLFAGSLTTTQPFVQTSTGVLYQGDQKTISSYGNTTDLFATNVTGDAAFGGFSSSMLGTTDLNPALTFNTPLADLNGGQGITPGSIQVSDGTHVSVINLSSASTIGDVAKLIEANPPTGRTVTVQVTNTGLTVQLDAAGGGSLAVSEVGGGTEAAQLGIKATLIGSPGPIVGTDLNPTLTSTTPLSNILGTKASVDIAAAGANNNVIVQAKANGTADNGVKVVYVNDAWYQAAPGITAGSEFATYNAAATPAKASLRFTGPNNDLILTANTPGSALNNVTVNVVNGGAIGNTATASYNAGAKTLTLTVDGTGATSTAAVIAAINTDGTFTSARDTSAEPNVAGGFIAPVDIHNGLGNTYLTGGDPNTIQVHIQSGQSTANGVVNAINALTGFTASLDPSEYGNTGAGQVTDAETDPAATGTLTGGSGAAFDPTGMQIVNGGKTYNVTFTGATTVQDVLNDINGSGASVFAQINQAQNGINIQSRLSGSDFSIGENGGLTATQLGVRTFNVNTPLADLNYGAGVRHGTGGDFTITRKDGVQFTVDISSAKTIGDVLNLINTNATNTGSGIPVVAQLDTTGNGIELVDNDPGTKPLTIATVNSSLAAQDLGLLAVGATTSAAPTPGVLASATVVGAGANNDLVFTAKNSSTTYNGVKVQFTTGAPLGGETVAYNAGAQTLTFNVNAATTANRVIAVLAADPVAGPLFSAALTPTDSGGPNNGTGTIDPTATGTLAGGTAETLSGTDTNPQEVSGGVFNALSRLQTALQNNDLSGIERATSLLQTAQQNLSLARAQLGANEQALTGLQSTVKTENTQLQGSLSNQTDADMAQVISDFVAKQTAYQAALQATGLISKLTLLDYL